MGTIQSKPRNQSSYNNKRGNYSTLPEATAVAIRQDIVSSPQETVSPKLASATIVSELPVSKSGSPQSEDMRALNTFKQHAADLEEINSLITTTQSLGSKYTLEEKNENDLDWNHNKLRVHLKKIANLLSQQTQQCLTESLTNPTPGGLLATRTLLLELHNQLVSANSCGIEALGLANTKLQAFITRNNRGTEEFFRGYELMTKNQQMYEQYREEESHLIDDIQKRWSALS